MKDHDREFVRSFLQTGGLHVELIPKMPPHQTPDLQVMLPEGDVLIEVKSKNDDQQLRKFLKSSKGTRLCYNASTLRSGLRKAKGQIRNFPQCKDADFALIWFITRKIGGITIFAESVAIGSLYGIESLEGYTAEQGEFYQKECFFFHESIFCEHRDLEGVVLHDAHSNLIKLCLNPYSPRYEAFKHTQFSNLFRDQFTVVDPKEMEAANQCFLADCTIAGNDPQEIAQYLGTKYGLKSIRRYIYSLVLWPVSS